MWPAAQRQSVIAVEAVAAVTAFAVQSVHGPGPMLPSQVPIGHAVQVDSGTVISPW